MLSFTAIYNMILHFKCYPRHFSLYSQPNKICKHEKQLYTKGTPQAFFLLSFLIFFFFKRKFVLFYHFE